MSFRDAYYYALMEVHNGRPVSVKTCFKGQQGELTSLSRTVCSCQKQPDGSLSPVYGFDNGEMANCFIDSLTPRERLIILGGGHIAQPLCEFAAKCDFAVTVVDDRMEFANEARFPLAKEVICDSFQDAIEKLRITAYDFVVVITRGHRFDADCLRALFRQREPAYLGMIGSRRRGWTRSVWDGSAPPSALPSVRFPRPRSPFPSFRRSSNISGCTAAPTVSSIPPIWI